MRPCFEPTKRPTTGPGANWLCRRDRRAVQSPSRPSRGSRRIWVVGQGSATRWTSRPARTTRYSPSKNTSATARTASTSRGRSSSATTGRASSSSPSSPSRSSTRISHSRSSTSRRTTTRSSSTATHSRASTSRQARAGSSGWTRSPARTSRRHQHASVRPRRQHGRRLRDRDGDCPLERTCQLSQSMSAVTARANAPSRCSSGTVCSPKPMQQRYSTG